MTECRLRDPGLTRRDERVVEVSLHLFGDYLKALLKFFLYFFTLVV